MTSALRAIVPGIALVALTSGCGPGVPEAAPVGEERARSAPTALEVVVASPERRPLEGVVEAPGTFFPDEEAVLSSEATGVVVAVRVEEGSRIRRGDELVRLEDTRAGLVVQQAEAILAQARANFEKAKSELARKEILLDDRTIAPAAFETFKAQYDAAAAGVDAADAALALARQQLADLTVFAPFTGVIKEKFVAEGEYVSPGDELLTLMRVDPLKLVFDVPEKHAARVQEGTAVDAQVEALPGETFSGMVRTIFPAVAIESRTVRVEARVANPAYRLRPGYYASVLVPLQSLPASLVVPRQALTTREGAEHVLVVDGDRVGLLRVVTGVETEADIEIVAGLTEDARLVVSDVEALQPGDRVQASGAN